MVRDKDTIFAEANDPNTVLWKSPPSDTGMCLIGAYGRKIKTLTQDGLIYFRDADTVSILPFSNNDSILAIENGQFVFIPF